MAGRTKLTDALNEVVDWRDVRDVGVGPVLDAIPDGWAKVDGKWLQVAQADRYDVEGPSGVIDGSQVLVTLPEREES